MVSANLNSKDAKSRRSTSRLVQCEKRMTEDGVFQADLGAI